MRKIFILFIAAGLVFATPSCKQCTECVKYPGKPIKLCKKDYASDDSYDAAYKHIIADGYKCN